MILIIVGFLFTTAAAGVFLVRLPIQFFVEFVPSGKRTFWPCKYSLGTLVFVCGLFKSASLPLPLFDESAWIRHNLSYAFADVSLSNINIVGCFA
jgi:hypothetical protein